MKIFVRILILVFITFGYQANAQTIQPTDSVSLQAPVIVAKTKVPQILAVRVVKVDTTSFTLLKKNNVAYADDIIQVLISNPKEFLLLRPTDNSKLVLFNIPFIVTIVYCKGLPFCSV